MTIKQFFIAASGVGLAVLFFTTNLFGPVKWLLIITSVLLGIGMAFLTFEERPMEVWVLAYIRAIYSPTQFIWRKKALIPDIFTFSRIPIQGEDQSQEMMAAAIKRKRAGLNTFIQTISENQIDTNLNKRESDHIAFVTSLFTSNQAPPTTITPPTSSNPLAIPQIAPTSPPANPTITTVAPARPPSQKSTQANQTAPLKKTTTQPNPTISTSPPQEVVKVLVKKNPPSLQPQQAGIIPNNSPKANPDKPISATQKETIKKSPPNPISQQRGVVPNNPVQIEPKSITKKPIRGEININKNSSPQPVPKKSTPITPSTPKTSTPATTDSSLPFPTTPQTPNTTTGMVISSTGHIIENAIIEVRDSEGTPVRATKTNKLGQFFSTTPLKNGQYEVEVEKDGYIFDIIKLNLKGQILNPLKIQAKNQ